MRFLTIALITLMMNCPAFSLWRVAQASGLDIPDVIEIPAGDFVFGSSAAEREFAYRLDETAYGHSRTRDNGWYAREFKSQTRFLQAFFITKNLISNRQYAQFVEATGHRLPGVDEVTWRSYGLIHPFERTHRHAWSKGLPAGREHHPVVLVSREDAEAYAKWLSRKTDQQWGLASEAQGEKAARGTRGWYFPWGNTFDASRLNSHDSGPFDTLPVGSYPQGASQFGMLDGAGQVFEWTSSNGGVSRAVVKGGSWDDSGCGVCRCAARHSRPVDLKHILIGFRLVRNK